MEIIVAILLLVGAYNLGASAGKQDTHVASEKLVTTPIDSADIADEVVARPVIKNTIPDYLCPPLNDGKVYRDLTRPRKAREPVVFEGRTP